jgi:hypothetical protein
MCRTVGHAWDQFYPQGMLPPSFGWRFSLRCTRCTSERHDLVSPTDGTLLSRAYYHADGYRLEKGVERPTREELRSDLFQRIREDLRKNQQIAIAVAQANGVKK